MKLTPADLLKKFFDTLNIEAIEYCVMNNYEDMPEIIPTDVDIAIESAAFGNLDRLIQNFSYEHGVEVIQKIWHGYNKCAYILSPLRITKRFRLQLDFFVDFSIKGYPCLMPADLILSQRERYKNFFVPTPALEVPFIMMRRILKNDLKKTHIDILRLLKSRDYEHIEAILRDSFGEEICDSIIQLIDSGDESIFQANLAKYRESLKELSSRNMTISYMIRYWMSQWKRAVNRLLHPIGFTVVFLGPDGSGKSTIAQQVLERVSGSFHGGKIQYWRPYLLPNIGRLKFWNPAEEIKVNPNPHKHPKQNPLRALLRFFYYVTDYIIGYPVKIYWAKVKKNMIIFDRYYYDYLVDLQRYQFNVPKWFPKVLLPLIPSPDMTIYLDANPAVLHERKKELSLSELDRQVREFRKVLPMIPNSQRISTNRPIEHILEEISYLILRAKSCQTKRILPNAN